MKPKTVAGLIISKRKSDGNGIQEEHADGDENHAMEAAAEDILRAISSKDAKHLALAIQAAYDICESSKSEDSESNDFDAQNEKAAEAQE